MKMKKKLSTMKLKMVNVVVEEIIISPHKDEGERVNGWGKYVHQKTT